MTIIELYLLLASLLMLATGFRSFFNNQKDEFNRTYFVFILFLAYWHFITFGMHSSERPEMASAWSILGVLQACGAPLFFHFILNCTGTIKNERSLRLYLLLYLPALLVSAGELAGILFAYEPVQHAGIWFLDRNNSIVEGFWVGWITSFMVLSILVTVSAFITGEKERKRTNATILASLVGLSVLGTVTYFVDIRTQVYSGIFIINGLALFAFTTYTSWRRNLFTISPVTAANDILMAIPDALFITTVEGAVVRSNPRACLMTGYDRTEICRLHIDTLFEEGFGRNLFGRVMNSDRFAWAQDAILKPRTGKEIPVVVNAALIQKTKRRIPVAMVISCHDSTFEKQALDEFRKTEQLEALGFLAGGIAHDFNNLLTSIVAYLSLARTTEKLSDSLKTTLDKVDSAAHLVINLNRQLATLSKGAVPDKTACSLSDIINDAVQLALSGSSIECRHRIPDDLHAVEADGTQLNQVFLNLLVNARQSMKQGGIIGIICSNTEHDGVPFVEVVITDQGCGIPGEKLEAVFKPFFTTKSQGTGLGLSVVKSVIGKHGGSISVSSRVGVGTSFVVRLPAYIYVKKDSTGTEPSSQGSPGSKPARILVMDDEEGVLKAIGLLLKRRGHTVVGVEQGGAAIKEFLRQRSEGKPFDLLILDVTIRNGYGAQEVIRRLKEIDPDVCAIVMSGYRDSVLMKEYREHGFAGVIQKPFEAEQIFQVIDITLQQRFVSS
jgi:PAS domain S-box-containing protein